MKRAFAALMAAAILALGACAAKEADVAAPETVVAQAPVVKVQPAETQAACATQGGQWQPICMMQKPACVLQYADAGKTCSDSAECSGRCQTSGAQPGQPAKGQCVATSDPCGCFQIVEKGKAGYPLCAD